METMTIRETEKVAVPDFRELYLKYREYRENGMSGRDAIVRAMEHLYAGSS